MTDITCREQPLIEMGERAPTLPRAARATIAMLEKIKNTRDNEKGLPPKADLH